MQGAVGAMRIEGDGRLRYWLDASQAPSYGTRFIASNDLDRRYGTATHGSLKSATSRRGGVIHTRVSPERVLASHERMRPFTVMHQFRTLPPERRRLVARAAWLVPLVRLGLWVLPFGRVRDLLALDPEARRSRRGARRPPRSPAGPVQDAVWAVVAVSRRVPRASCLTQALVAQRLLAEDGLDSDLRIGVARDVEGAFEAHAWLEREGLVLLGEVEGMARFTPVAPTGDER